METGTKRLKRKLLSRRSQRTTYRTLIRCSGAHFRRNEIGSSAPWRLREKQWSSDVVSSHSLSLPARETKVAVEEMEFHGLPPRLGRGGGYKNSNKKHKRKREQSQKENAGNNTFSCVVFSDRPNRKEPVVAAAAAHTGLRQP